MGAARRSLWPVLSPRAGQFCLLPPPYINCGGCQGLEARTAGAGGQGRRSVLENALKEVEFIRNFCPVSEPFFRKPHVKMISLPDKKPEQKRTGAAGSLG